MANTDNVAQLIFTGFENNPYPGDDFLLGSRQGCEPAEEVWPFQGQTNWKELTAEFLDQHAGALHFFSEAGLRFFLPAFLLADLRGELQHADPLFTLTHGFSDITVEVTKNDRKFQIKSGKSQLLNPNLYGAATFLDYAHYRLSIFTREEARAIVAYLEFKQSRESADRDRIESAFDQFWRERARTAPTASDLRDYIKSKKEYIAALLKDNETKIP
jgi:hypothetical protein